MEIMDPYVFAFHAAIVSTLDLPKGFQIIIVWNPTHLGIS